MLYLGTLGEKKLFRRRRERTNRYSCQVKSYLIYWKSFVHIAWFPLNQKYQRQSNRSEFFNTKMWNIKHYDSTENCIFYVYLSEKLWLTLYVSWYDNSITVGYSTCHWCHVMERESFENEEIGKLMNDNFVNIKVDREERPDVDSVYMTFVQVSLHSVELRWVKFTSSKSLDIIKVSTCSLPFNMHFLCKCHQWIGRMKSNILHVTEKCNKNPLNIFYHRPRVETAVGQWVFGWRRIWDR